MLLLRPFLAVLSAALGTLPGAHLSNVRSTTINGDVVTVHARGTFDVKVTPAPSGDNDKAPAFGRLRLDKRFHGDLDATSIGEMMAAGTEVQGSAGYVALERVTGTLNGRRGTFVLQHSGSMQGGSMQLIIGVVPDSGTDQLVGLSGTMGITIAPDGTHSYDLEYSLPG